MSEFTHLHVHTEYSMLDGYGKIKALVSKAKKMGQTALAITDHGFMHGVIPFYKECRSAGIKPIIGVELYTAESLYLKDKDHRQAGHLVLLVKNEVGYKNLVALCSTAATDGLYYGKPRTDLNQLAKHHDGLVCLSACLQGDVPRLLLEGKEKEALNLAAQYKRIFGPDYYIELQYHGLKEQKAVLGKLIRLAHSLEIPMVATNDVHYVEKSDAKNQRTLMCMGTGKTVGDQTALGYNNPDHWYLKSQAEMEEIFGTIAPEAITNSGVIADQCNLEIQEGVYHLPTFPLPEGWKSNYDYFHALCNAGLRKRYRNEAPKHQARLDYEVGVIQKMGFVDYFLIVWDIILFARKNDIPIGPGRGSSAGSMVAYCMGITNIDPVRFGLLFERFLNPDRITMPDIDIDIDPEGRELVIDHLCGMYGREKISQIVAYHGLAARGAIRDTGRALNIDRGIVEKVAKLIPEGNGMTIKETLETNRALMAQYNDPTVQKLIDVSMGMEGLVSHISTHAAGVIIAPAPITDFVPIQKDKNDKIISQYDMAGIEFTGLLKVDLLGLRTLTVLKQAEAAIQEDQKYGGPVLHLSRLKLQDQGVYQMLAQGETAGVFQLESDGMKNVLRKMQPTCIEDLTAAISLYRPGPMESIPSFCECKHNPEKVTYLHPSLEPILKGTYGTIVYQEQVMAIVRELAGYSLGRADLIRRAMSKKKHDVMAREREIFIHGETDANGTIIVEGCLRRGVSETVASKIWDEMSSFASYAFNKSHAACYAVVAYETAFLRYHYPLQYMAALMTNAINAQREKLLGFIADCNDRSISVLPPDINKSEMAFHTEGNAIRFALMAIKNTGKAMLAEILMERNLHGPFIDLQDLVERTVSSANKGTLEALIMSGALDCMPHTRAEKLAILPALIKAAATARKKQNDGQIALDSAFFSDLNNVSEERFQFEKVPYPENVQELSHLEMLRMEREVTGIYISGHPISAYRDDLKGKATHKARDLIPDTCGRPCLIREGDRVRIGGIITAIKSLTTKKKRQMGFVTIEDETGKVEVTVFPNAYEAYMGILTDGAAVLIYGKVECSDEYGMKLIADSISKLAADTERVASH